MQVKGAFHSVEKSRVIYIERERERGGERERERESF